MHLDVGIHDYAAIPAGGRAGGECGKLRAWEDAKRSKRGAVAAAAGAVFVAFIMAAQGALGKEANQFMVDFRAERSDAQLQWWWRRLVTLALRGSHRAAVNSYNVHSGYVPTSQRTHQSTVSAPSYFL